MSLQVIDLCPEDWAVVIATRGVFAVARPKHGPTKSWAPLAHGSLWVNGVNCLCVHAASRTSRKFTMQLTIVDFAEQL